MRSLALVLCLVGVAVAGPGPEGAVRPTDIERIRELYRLTDRFGEQLWPGFDARTVPIGLNHENRLELLIAHPEPPAAFRVLPGYDLRGVPILIRDGSDRFGPGSGGVAADLYGIYAVYMNTLQPGSTTENYLSIFLHECFHVYQRKFREYPDGQKSGLPEHDAAYSALTGLESHVLHTAVMSFDDEEAIELTRMFLAIRRERRAELPASVVRAEDDGEYNEGTATYVQVRLFELLTEAGPIESELEDPHYDGFRTAAADRERMLEKIRLSKTRAIRFHLAKYQTGLAQCLLLDRFKAGWKEELRAKGSTLTDVLGGRVPVRPEEVASLFSAAKTRFDYDTLLAEQTRLVESRLAKIRKHLVGPGRRYCIHLSGFPGVPRSRPRGPAYQVPKELRARPGSLTIYVQGVWHQRGGLTVETQRVPVLMNPGYVEWIDRQPAADESDLRIEYERRTGSVYEGLRMTTDGFVLTADRASVRITPDVVTVRAAPRAGR